MMIHLALFSSLPINTIYKWMIFVKDIYINFFMLAEYARSDERPNITTLLLTIGLIGGTIIITLAYVSWRKYKGEMKEKQKQYKSKQ